MLAGVLAVVAHGVTGACTYTLLSRGPTRLISAFPIGAPSVSLTIVTANDEAPRAGDVAKEEAPTPVEPPPLAAAAPIPETAPLPPPPAADGAAEAPTVEAAVVAPTPAPDTPVAPPAPGPVAAAVRETPPPAAAENRAGQGERPRMPPVATEAAGSAGRSPFLGLDDIRARYPLGARMRGEEGVVSVRVIVNAKGRADRVEVTESSRFPSLDRAAVEAVKRARFVTEGGIPAAGGEAALAFRFKLVD